MAEKLPSQEAFLSELDAFIEDLQAIRQRVGAVHRHHQEGLT